MHLYFIVTPSQYLQLFALFGDLLSRALILVDKRAISQYTYQDQPPIYAVTSGKDRYLVQSGVNFCSCPSHRYQVTQSNAEFTCKHVLACRLATILCRHTTTAASEEFFTALTDDHHQQQQRELAGAAASL